MARKLKSDRVLFIATLLLVGLSIVMVYSASAVVAMERTGQPNLFLTKQGLWAALGIAVLLVVMRIDYRIYREPAFIWSSLGFVALLLVAVLFSPPVNNARRWFADRRPRHAAVGAREAGRHLLHRRAARAPDAPDQRARVLAAADRRRGRHAGRA